MTVSSATNEVDFQGNDVATAFSLPFRFFSDSDIIAQLIDDASGAIEVLTLGVDYTLTGAGEPDIDGSPTGILTTTDPVATGFTLFVRRELPLTQPTDIVNQGRFFPETHETVFDRTVMQIQQAVGGLGKALRVQPTEPAPGFVPSIATRANKLLSFDSQGNPTAVAPADGSAAALAIDLANDSDPAKGAGMVGWKRTPLSNVIENVGQMLDTQAINIWEFAHLITDKPTESDPWSWDWAPAVQGASDFIRAAFNAVGPGVSNVIEFPGGRYKINSQVVISAFVKLKSTGLVIFETNVSNAAAFWFTPSAGDYSSNTAVLDKQQWHRGPFINGSDGGFVFKNVLPSLGCTAIEIGPRSDLSALRPFSRYSACDFAVTGYAIGMKFNRFRNYIGHFNRVHLETNTENCVFGDSGTVVTDSGENITFTDSVFATCETSFRWYCDGFDVNFSNCSFDYIGTIFRMHRLYKKITVSGGHIEWIGGSRAHDSIGGIAVDESVDVQDAGILCLVLISGVCAYIAPGRMFRGSSGRLQVALDMEFRKLGTDNTPTTAILCDSGVTVRRCNVVIQQRATIPSWGINKLRNATFTADTVGTDVKTAPPAGYAVIQDVSSAVISADASSLGGKSIKITGKSSGSYYQLQSTSKMPVSAGDTVMATLFVKFPTGGTGTPNVASMILFYDENDTELSRTSESLSDLGPENISRGDYCSPAYARQARAPVGAVYFKTRHGVSGNALDSQEVHITGLYAAVLK